MSPKTTLGLLLAILAAAEPTDSAHASDPGSGPRLKVSLIPRKSASARTRSLECVQKWPGFVLWDADKKIVPGETGYVYYLEQSDGYRLLLTDQNEGARGWTFANAIVPVSEAEEYFSGQIEVSPKNAFAYLMRGVVRLENDDLDQALADLDQALKLEPNSVPALIARAALMQWLNRLDQAIADATRAIALAPRNSYALVERGVFYFHKREYDKARDDFDKAIERGYKGAVVVIGRGMINLQKGDWKKAQAEFNEALRIDPKHPDAYCGIASIFLRHGDIRNGLAALDQAVERDPDSAESHGNRAIILLSTGRYDKALEDLDDVLRVAPDSARALRERAWLLATCPIEKLRNGEEALKSAGKACDLTGWTEPHALTTLAAAFAEIGNFGEALKWQQKALELVPDKDPETAEYRKVLERYREKKPYRRLTLLEEWGIQKPRAAARKGE